MYYNTEDNGHLVILRLEEVLKTLGFLDLVAKVKRWEFMSQD